MLVSLECHVSVLRWDEPDQRLTVSSSLWAQAQCHAAPEEKGKEKINYLLLKNNIRMETIPMRSFTSFLIVSKMCIICIFYKHLWTRQATTTLQHLNRIEMSSQPIIAILCYVLSRSICVFIYLCMVFVWCVYWCQVPTMNHNLPVPLSFLSTFWYALIIKILQRNHKK